MDNYAIAEQLSLLAKLLDIHGDNSFKSKTYASAAFAIEKLPQQVESLSHDKIFSIKGIGQSVGQKVIEILETGQMAALQELIANTPEGILEMMNIKGLGPKKIHTLWKDMHIDNIDTLEKACAENRVSEKKGFGEKTQQNILDSIRFQKNNAGKNLYARLEPFAEGLLTKLQEKFPRYHTAISGAFRRQLEVLDELDYVTTVPADELVHFLKSGSLELILQEDHLLVFTAEDQVKLRFFLTNKSHFFYRLFETSSSEAFLTGWNKTAPTNGTFENEEAIFSTAGLPYIPPYLRDDEKILAEAGRFDYGKIIRTSDIKGLIHAHSNWSDGAYTIEEMAETLIEQGFEYLVISDHSKAAYYANGLTEQRIREQHRYIDDLNKKLKPFKIFKSIECDILNDGSLDYENKILSTFDLVITSVHSNLDMDEEKAMRRLLGAITNPYTTILGHMTGRLLLRRKGYPVDHEMIIDACADNHVVIEINASPSRLDMDWRWIPYALEKGVMLSIDPDAHATEEFENIKYGVLVAQKGGLPSTRNLSSMGLQEFEAFIQKRKKDRKLS